jgi:hypothetical protein
MQVFSFRIVPGMDELLAAFLFDRGAVGSTQTEDLLLVYFPEPSDLGQIEEDLQTFLAQLRAGGMHFPAVTMARERIAAQENISLNRVQDCIKLYAGTLAALQPRPVDMILANLQHQALLSLLADFSQRLRQEGILLLSGLLEHEDESIQQALENSGLRCMEIRKAFSRILNPHVSAIELINKDKQPVTDKNPPVFLWVINAMKRI